MNLINSGGVTNIRQRATEELLGQFDVQNARFGAGSVMVETPSKIAVFDTWTLSTAGSMQMAISVP